jgi:crotonobetainyl-CoA:carnitine CoA-transferase CaiB-like acyl-CoA transferase
VPARSPARIDATSPDDLPVVGADLPQGTVALAACALRALDAAAGPVTGDGPATAASVEDRARALLALRARLLGMAPHGRVSAGGACRLLPAADAWVAVGLPRPADVDLLPAWLGLVPGGADGLHGPVDVDTGVGAPWAEVRAAVSRRRAAELVAAAQELGLAVAVVPTPAQTRGSDEQVAARGTDDPDHPWVVRGLGDPVPPGSRRRFAAEQGPTVVDLSSLWAGPSCARLFGQRGARVVKVESTQRPDGARRGPAAFHDAVNAGKELVELPLHTGPGREALVALLATADVVVEGSRPRALEQMGIEPGTWGAGRPGRVWVSITGYGRTGPWRNRVAFGDDAAAAGGLVAWDAEGRPAFVGDALADPLAGVVAAARAATAWRSGGGVSVDVALREVARAAALGARPVFDPFAGGAS